MSFTFEVFHVLNQSGLLLNGHLAIDGKVAQWWSDRLQGQHSGQV